MKIENTLECKCLSNFRRAVFIPMLLRMRKRHTNRLNPGLSLASPYPHSFPLSQIFQQGSLRVQFTRTICCGLTIMEMLEKAATTCFEDKLNAVQDILKDSVSVDESSRSITSVEPARQFILGAVSEITENLLLSSAAAVLPSTLDALSVGCVINVAEELPDTPLHNDSIMYYKINVQDSSNSDLAPYFDDTSDIIHNIALSGGRTLVHCVAGVSRSASICIAYLMKHHNLSLLESYNHVKQRRSSIRPNCGFFRQLIDYEHQLFGCNTVSMVYNEYLKMDIPDVYDAQYRYLSTYRKKCRDIVGRY